MTIVSVMWVVVSRRLADANIPTTRMGHNQGTTMGDRKVLLYVLSSYSDSGGTLQHSTTVRPTTCPRRRELRCTALQSDPVEMNSVLTYNKTVFALAEHLKSIGSVPPLQGAFLTPSCMRGEKGLEIGKHRVGSRVNVLQVLSRVGLSRVSVQLIGVGSQLRIEQRAAD
ncbi:hypothetical protein C8Q74DRAFT_424786 [Fomes fomentarius]|nr:hypothetical protein C8Q74DRAFT_424786 [Fomes fomentarius]